ncbi:hypothetical protein HDU97_001293 [Phlyctochytrium planicorne]|nr:hypothetical protein HDU97_001293 [Phlyctochytrium planicorne]
MTSTKNVLIVGGTRGLGFALLEHLIALKGHNIFVTSRGPAPKISALPSVTVIEGVDISNAHAGKTIADAIPGTIDEVFCVAGYFSIETLETLNWEEQRKMFDICAIGPLFIIQALLLSGKIKEGSKIILITSEGGSIALRTHEEGGGNYGHHMSKAAQNMMGKLLAIDLKPKGIPVVMIHPGFLKTEMTRGVGFDQYYESGGAVEPHEAIDPLLQVINCVNLDNTGKFIAPLGPKGVGNAHVIGEVSELPTPLELPCQHMHMLRSVISPLRIQTRAFVRCAIIRKEYPGEWIRPRPSINDPPIDAPESEFTIKVPKPIRPASETIETKRARLVWMSRKRGILETDLLLSTYANKKLNQLSENALRQYDDLLEENDWDIYYWATGAKVVPKHIKEMEFWDDLVDHCKNRERVVLRMPELS